jgi:hypothetical protein
MFKRPKRIKYKELLKKRGIEVKPIPNSTSVLVICDRSKYY